MISARLLESAVLIQVRKLLLPHLTFTVVFFKIIFDSLFQLLQNIWNRTYDPVPAWDERLIHGPFQKVITSTHQILCEQFNSLLLSMTIIVKAINNCIIVISIYQIKSYPIVSGFNSSENL